MISPTFFRGRAVVLRTAMASPPIDSLTNKLRTPVLIHEFRFQFQYSTGGGRIAGLFADMRFNREPLTNGEVPIIAFCQLRSSADEVFLPAAGGALAVPTWRLPSPLLFLPGETIRIYFRNSSSGSALTTDVTATVDLVCSALPSDYPIPRARRVPWIAAHVGPVVAFGSSLTDESTEAELHNPSSVDPLVVERFTGEMASDGFAPVGATDYKNQVTIRAADDRGNHIIRDPTPFGLAFPPTTRNLITRTRLPPGGFAVFSLSSQALVPDGVAVSIQPIIGMVGERDVRV